MNREDSRVGWAAFLAAALPAMALMATPALAVNPEVLRRGADLFQHEFSSQHPMLGSDGLGPLFNARSCVACHHQGGVGGSGDARFNAKALEIESLEVSRPTTLAAVAIALRQIHPGFASSDGSPVATVNLPHFGGSSVMDRLRASTRTGTEASTPPTGGEASAVEVRRRSDHRWTVTVPVDLPSRRNTMKVELVVHQRNTSPLFGLAQVDAIAAKTLERLEKLQKRNPEISGRVSLLDDGTLGRFGWRANEARLAGFVRQACANEMGLASDGMPQPVDPSTPGSMVGHSDISDADVAALTSFVASLPAPTSVAMDAAADIERGRTAFEKIGCAVCHVQNVGPAKNVYSDFLLHDMGPNLYDYAAAEPDVKSVQLTIREGIIASTRIGYYGSSQPLLPTRGLASSITVHSRLSTPKHHSGGNDFLILEKGPAVVTEVAVGSNTQRRVRQRQKGWARQLNPSMVAQEWKTPPLWGVADSVPYLHDGRAETLLEAVMMHGGEAEPTRNRFLNLSFPDREALIAFLKTMQAPPVADAI